MDETSLAALGSRGVSRREMEVLAAVEQRLTNGEIAARLHVSERTVESHVSSLLRKFGSRNRLELARRTAWGPGVADWYDRGLPRRLEIIEQQAVLVGRESELRRLLAAWDRVTLGAIAVVVVRGEAGIGKSRLVARVAAEVYGRGGQVLFGACADRSARAYEPFAVAIADAVACGRVDELRAGLGRSAALLGRLDPAIAHHFGIAGLDEADPDHERHALQDAICDFLLLSARLQPALFVVEDVQWATAGSRDALVHVSSSGAGVPLMLLITARDERPDRDEPSGVFLGRLTATTSVETVTLRGLDVNEAAALIAAVGGDIDPERAVHQSNGNPLYLRELARDRGRSLEDLVAARFALLDPDDLEVADAATVVGDQINAELLASVVGRPLDGVLDALDRIESHGLVGPGDRPGQYAFTHDLFRSFRYESLSAGRRMRLHAGAARTLEEFAGDPGVVGELARHACLAGSRFDVRRAAELARRAGDAASSLTEHDEAAVHYRRACDAFAVAGMADSAAHLAVKIRLGASLMLMEDPAGRTTLRDAAVEAQRRGDAIAVAEAVAAMGFIPGGSYSNGRADPLVTALTAVALEHLPPDEDRWRIELQAHLGVHLLCTDDPEGGTALVGDAVEAARRLGDPVTLGRALLSWRFCGSPADSEQRLACGRELIELGARTGLEVFSCVGRQQLWWCYRQLGDLAEMDRWYQSAAEHVHALDLEQRSFGPAAALLAGDLDEMARLTEALGEDLGTTGDGPIVYVRVPRLWIKAARGHLPGPEELERAFADIVPPEVLRPMMAAAHARTGEPDRARALLEATRRDGFPPPHAARAGAAPLCAWADVASAVDDRDAADELGHLLEPLAGQLVDNGILVEDSIDRVRALLRLAVEDTSGATAIVTDAVAASRQRRTPLLLGRELVIVAAARERAGADRADVRSVLHEALEIGARTGAGLIAIDAARHIAEASHSAGDDPFGLTPREREIIDHVASGATNAQIAVELGISSGTVRKHVEHAFKKLDVSTRTSAVARLAAAREQRQRSSSAVRP